MDPVVVSALPPPAAASRPAFLAVQPETGGDQKRAGPGAPRENATAFKEAFIPDCFFGERAGAAERMARKRVSAALQQPERKRLF